MTETERDEHLEAIVENQGQVCQILEKLGMKLGELFERVDEQATATQGLVEVQVQMTDRMLGLAQGVEHLTDETQRAIDHFVWRGLTGDEQA
ncbi:MAG: hypothetical protein QM747_03260 [Nocardioides sp.]